MIADLVCSNNDNDAQTRDRTDPNYHGKVNRMLYLFLAQANGDALSEVVFKPLENLRLFGGWNCCKYLECHLTFLLVLNTLKCAVLHSYMDEARYRVVRFSVLQENEVCKRLTLI